MPELPSPDGLFRQVLRDARALAGFDDPLDAELWVSGLIGLWQGMALHDEDPDRFFGLGLVHYAGRRLTPSALALLLGLAAVAPEEIAGPARQAAARLAAKDVPPPRWQETIGTCAFTSAWSAANPYGDWELLVVGFAYPGRPAHSVSVDIDHNTGGVITDAAVGPAPEEVLRDWQAPDGEHPEDGADDEDRVETLEAAEAARRLRAALAASARDEADDGPDPAAALLAELGEELGGELDVDDLGGDELGGDLDDDEEPDGGLRSARALILARLRVLPEPEGPGEEAGGGPPDRQAVAEAFLASPEAAGLDRGDDREALECLLDFHEELGTGQPLRWSPELVEELLLGWLPIELLGEAAAAEDALVARVPDVLSAFVRYAGRERGLADHLTQRTVATVEELREDFRAAMGDPQGHLLSRTVTLAMQADGVDLDDQDAREAWLGQMVQRLHDHNGDNGDNNHEPGP